MFNLYHQWRIRFAIILTNDFLHPSQNFRIIVWKSTHDLFIHQEVVHFYHKIFVFLNIGGQICIFLMRTLKSFFLFSWLFSCNFPMTFVARYSHSLWWQTFRTLWLVAFFYLENIILEIISRSFILDSRQYTT